MDSNTDALDSGYLDSSSTHELEPQNLKNISKLSSSAADIIKAVVETAANPDPEPSGYKPFLFQSLYDDPDKQQPVNEEECLIKKHKMLNRAKFSSCSDIDA